MSNLSEKQKEALSSLVSGPGAIALVHFGKLRDLGLVGRSESTQASRGYVGAYITDAGRAAVQG